MQTFKRPSAAYKAAGDRPILIVRVGRETLYIVGDLEPLDSVELVSPPRCYGMAKTPSRFIAAHVILGHLDRLGNANGAAAAEYNRDRRVWPDRWGMKETFINAAHATQCEVDRCDRIEK